MKNKLTILVLLLLSGLNIYAQESKYIEVTGSAQMMINPDEFIYIIGIKEYWKEEFVKGKKFEDYKNKVEISKIENQLIKDLISLGIKEKNIKSTEIGNRWRNTGKEFLIGKKLEVTLTDFQTVNQINAKVDRKGIDYMLIGELKNKDLVNYRKDVKKEALIAAKKKAEYLLEAIGKKVGDVISITELNSDNYFWRPPLGLTSNVQMVEPDNLKAESDKKIELRAEIRAKFEIK